MRCGRQISAVYGLNLNIGRFLTRGIDFTANYAFEPRAIWERLPGRVELNVTGTHLDSLRQFTNASDPRTQIQFEGFRGFPNWQVLSTATYSVDRLAVTWRLRFLDSTSVAASQLIVSPIAPAGAAHALWAAHRPRRTAPTSRAPWS